MNKKEKVILETKIRMLQDLKKQYEKSSIKYMGCSVDSCRPNTKTSNMYKYNGLWCFFYKHEIGCGCKRIQDLDNNEKRAYKIVSDELNKLRHRKPLNEVHFDGVLRVEQINKNHPLFYKKRDIMKTSTAVKRIKKQMSILKGGKA